MVERTFFRPQSKSSCPNNHLRRTPLLAAYAGRRHRICVHENRVEDTASLDGGHLQVNGPYVFPKDVFQSDMDLALELTTQRHQGRRTIPVIRPPTRSIRRMKTAGGRPGCSTGNAHRLLDPLNNGYQPGGILFY